MLFVNLIVKTTKYQIIAIILLFSIAVTDLCFSQNHKESFPEIEETYSENNVLANSIILGGLIGSSFIFDNQIRKSIKKNHSAGLDKVTNAAKYLGEGKELIVISGLTFAGGYIFDSRDVENFGMELTSALIVTGTATIILKAVFGRYRPNVQKGSGNFFNYKFNNDNWSFPSGHSSTAFTITSYLASKTENTYLKIGLYSLSSLTAFQRIYDDEHWFSDVTAGAVVGILVGSNYQLFTDFFRKNLREISFLPAFDQNGAALTLLMQF